MTPGLFVVEGNDPSELTQGLQALSAHLKNAPGRDDPLSSSGKKDPILEPMARSWYFKNRSDANKNSRCVLWAGVDRNSKHRSKRRKPPYRPKRDRT
jgi:hypothetical protein